MYLIFLVLAALQIPLGWLKITNTINNYLQKPQVKFQDSALFHFSNQIVKMKSDFEKELKPDIITGKMPDENSFSVTDRFFIKNGNGKTLFREIEFLKNWINLLPKNDWRKAYFALLFEEDLKNGLENGDAKAWLKYRWKHVPICLAKCLLEELNLRSKLLNKGNVSNEIEVTEPTFSLMTDYSYMRVGDKATLSAKGDTLLSVNITRNRSFSNDFKRAGTSFIFKPTVSGLYQIKAKGKFKSEVLAIQVLPASFPKKESLPFRICYTGVSYEQKVSLFDKSARIYCEGDPEARIDATNGKLIFKPMKEGWCTIKVNTGEGVIFLDSVMVKTIPDPIFQIKELPTLKVSKKRLEQLSSIEIVAMHPSFKQQVYQIKSFQTRWVGLNSRNEKNLSNTLSLDNKNLAGLQYIILYNIEVKMGSGQKLFDKAIIIETN